MVLVRIRPESAGGSQYVARGNNPTYVITFNGSEPVDVPDAVAKRLVSGSGMYEIVDADSPTAHTKDELEKMTMKELREIGKPLGAADTSKSELIEEIMQKEAARYRGSFGPLR